MEKRMARFIQRGDRPEAGAELAMTGWKLARLFLGVAIVGPDRARRFAPAARGERSYSFRSTRMRD